jgi:hypothetical protein
MTFTVGGDGLRSKSAFRAVIIRLRAAPPYEFPFFQGAHGDAPFDYFTVRGERDRLASTAERNMLGQLKGTAGSWQQLVSAYEKGGECDAHLALTAISQEWHWLCCRDGVA